jgi:hypothetical protein
MKTFKEWLLQREMLSPVPFPAITAPQRAGLGLTSALQTGKAKITKWRRNLSKPKASEDGQWR